MDKLAKQGIFSYHNNGDGYVGTCKKWDMIPEKVPVQGPEKERTVVGAVLSLFLATEKRITENGDVVNRKESAVGSGILEET